MTQTHDEILSYQIFDTLKHILQKNYIFEAIYSFGDPDIVHQFYDDACWSQNLHS